MSTIWTVNGQYPGTKLKGKERFKRLYHYTSFDAFVKIWNTKQLKYGSLLNVNDIQEKSINVLIKNSTQLTLMYAYKDIRTLYKQISLTMDYDSYIKGCMSPMMWGLYADKTKGVCIEIDYDRLFFPKGTIKGIVEYKKVLPKYVEIPVDKKSQKDVQKYIYNKRKQIFFTKQRDWAGENEYRVISSNTDYLDISNAIKTIYLSSCESEECLLVEKLVADCVPVKFIHYNSVDNKSIPIVSSTKQCREQMLSSNSNPNNSLSSLSKQAESVYEDNKKNRDLDITKCQYTYNGNKE